MNSYDNSLIVQQAVKPYKSNGKELMYWCFLKTGQFFVCVFSNPFFQLHDITVQPEVRKFPRSEVRGVECV